GHYPSPRAGPRHSYGRAAFARKAKEASSMAMLARLLICALMLAGPAAAQEAPRARGTLQATAYAPLPDGPMAIRPPDGSQESADVALILSEALAGLGRASDPGAPLLLSFRIGDLPGVVTPRAPDIELRGSLGAEGNEDAEVLLRMQMLERRPRPGPTRTRLIVIEVSDRAGKPVWEARLEASGAANDAALVEALARPLLSRLGQDAYGVQLVEPAD